MKPDAYRQLAAVESAHWWYVGMRATARALLPERLGAVLDAGCGTGGWLGTLATSPRVGVDLHRGSLALARAGSIAAAQADIQQLPFGDETFDTVTSLDVVYHQAVADDVAAAGELCRVLRPGGRALVQVPAYNWLRSAHDDDVATRERYTAGRLRDLLTAAGFAVDRTTYANALLLPLAVAWRLATRFLPRGAGGDLSVPPPLLNRLGVAVLAGERRILARRDLPAGLSVIALAHRPARHERDRSPMTREPAP